MRQKPGPANSMGKMKFMFPNPQGIWLHDTPEKEKIDEAARLQSNGCVRLEDAPRFARWLFNGRPPKPQGAKPEQKVNLPAPVPLYITYLTAVPSGTSIVYFDDFYGKDRAAALASSRAASRLALLVEVVRPEHRDRVALLVLRGKAREIELLVELHAELARLRPADDAATGPTPTMSIASSVAGRNREVAFDHRAHRGDVAQLHLAVSPSMTVIARRISRWRGSRVQAKPSASTVTLFASSRATAASLGLAEDVALDHADAELADQLQVVVRLDALGAGVHAQRFGQRHDGADDRRVAVGRSKRRRERSSGRS